MTETHGQGGPHHDLLLQMLVENSDRVVAETVRRARGELPPYDRFDADLLPLGFGVQPATLLQCVRSGRAPEEADLAQLAEIRFEDTTGVSLRGDATAAEVRFALQHTMLDTTSLAAAADSATSAPRTSHQSPVRLELSQPTQFGGRQLR